MIHYRNNMWVGASTEIDTPIFPPLLEHFVLLK
jgi:hypothetical protein